jgi:cardiolipin synthase
MFVERYLVELRRDRFRPAAWVRYVRAALSHARERALANPAAVRSILFVGLLLFFAALASAVLLALLAEPGLARRAFGWTVVGLVPMIGLTLLHVDLLRDRGGTPLDALGWPSAITLTRVALVPAFLVFMIEGRFGLGFAVFAAAIVSDVVDGWAARRFHQETLFGAILDPLADILCSFWLFFGLWLGGLVSPLIAVLAALRMLMLLAGGAYLHLTLGPVHIHSTVPGRLTGLLITALVTARITFAALDVGPIAARLTPLVLDAMIVILAFTIVSGYVVGWVNLRRLQKRRTAAPVVTDARFGA